MIFGYNTNGFAHHRLSDALRIIAELGYTGVALTPDVHHLDPLTSDEASVQAVAELLYELNLKCVIETGARFLLDPRRKHQPTLISSAEADREQRIAFLWRCISLAEELGAEVVSFWSGTPEEAAPRELLFDRLAESCRELLDFAEDRVKLAFEPEPGMLVATLADFAELDHRLDQDDRLGLTLDIGHLVCQGELPISARLAEWRQRLRNVHLDDMRPGVHDHLMFGEGAVDFADVFAGLKAIGYEGMVSVELSRHSHVAVTTARDSLAFLRRFL